MSARFKRPVSVLVVIHTPDLQVLLLERAKHPGFWQSVTGSLETEETPLNAAHREVTEETGLDARAYELSDWQQTHRYKILDEWRHRYAPENDYNTEHVFSLCLPRPLPVRLSVAEHRSSLWQPCQTAAASCFSWSNRDSILALPQRMGIAAGLKALT